MYIKVTQRNHIERLAVLAREIWVGHFGPMIDHDILDAIIERVQSEKAIAEQIEEGYLYYLIQPEDKPAGYFAYQIRLAERELFLSKLYLLASERRKGLGRQVLHHLEEICSACGLTRLKLTVFHKNTSAVRVYETYGFKNLGTIARDLGHGIVIADYEMEKTVSPAIR